MIIERVTIKNFGPFEDENVFDLKPRNGNITIVLGDSGSGKTHFGKAIRWALYNLPFYSSEEAKKRRSEDAEEKPYDKSQILTFFYRPGGGAVDLSKPPKAREMSTVLELRPSSSMRGAMEARDLLFGDYTLSREASLPYSRTFPSWKDVTTPNMKLQGPHQRLEGAENPEAIIDEFFLPASTSIFFMFHGERIKSLTEQISDPVGESIKKILDITPMNNAVEDLESVSNEFLDEVEASKEKEKELETHQKYRRNLTELIQKKKTELKAAGTRLKTFESELKSNRDAQKEVMEAMGLKDEFSRIEREIGDKKEMLDDKDTLLKASRDDFTREALFHILTQDVADRKEIDDENKRIQAKIAEYETEKKKLESLREGEECPTCTQVVGANFLRRAKARTKELESSIKFEREKWREPDPNYIELQLILSELKNRKYKPEKLGKEMGDLRAKLRDLRNRRQDIRKKIRNQGQDADRAESLQKREAELETLKGRAERDVWDLEQEIKRRERELVEEQNRITGLGKGAKGRLAGKRADLAQALKAVFSEVVVDHAKAKKDQIARGTGQALLELTIKPYLFSKEPIKIDDKFQLSVYNSKGNTLPWEGEATGERGILSMAFIYGLLKASERDAPVILDTAFGNLAPGHIKNLSRLLPKFGPQVMLLLTLLEYKALRENAEKVFWEHVDKYIILCHHNSTRESTEVKITDDAKTANREFEKEFEESIAANPGRKEVLARARDH